MSRDLPPGVTESMIPGNRPEDQEVEITLVLTVGGIEDLKRFHCKEILKERKQQHWLYPTIANITDQIWESGL